MESPIFLLVSAQVLGLSVSFSNPLNIDFGVSNELGVPVSRTLTVTNTSGIPTTLDNLVVLYSSAVTPTPPLLPKPGTAEYMCITDVFFFMLQLFLSSVAHI